MTAYIKNLFGRKGSAGPTAGEKLSIIAPDRESGA
jgi:hypothetical protein